MENIKLKFLDKLTSKSKVSLGLGALIIKNYRSETRAHKTKRHALPVEKQEILLELRADCGLWCVPGGRLNPGESIEECVRREIKEETNIDVILDDLFCVYSHPEIGTLRHYLEDDFSQHVIDIFLIGFPISHKIKKSKESLDVKFFKFDNLPNNLVPTLAMAIKDYKSTYRLDRKAILR